MTFEDRLEIFIIRKSADISLCTTKGISQSKLVMTEKKIGYV